MDKNIHLMFISNVDLDPKENFCKHVQSVRGHPV